MHPSITWKVGDITQPSCEAAGVVTGHFALVVDKGTLDCVFCESGPPAAAGLLEQVHRVRKKNPLSQHRPSQRACLFPLSPKFSRARHYSLHVYASFPPPIPLPFPTPMVQENGRLLHLLLCADVCIISIINLQGVETWRVVAVGLLPYASAAAAVGGCGGLL